MLKAGLVAAAMALGLVIPNSVASSTTGASECGPECTAYCQCVDHCNLVHETGSPEWAECVDGCAAIKPEWNCLC